MVIVYILLVLKCLKYCSRNHKIQFIFEAKKVTCGLMRHILVDTSVTDKGEKSDSGPEKRRSKLNTIDQDPRLYPLQLFAHSNKF